MIFYLDYLFKLLIRLFISFLFFCSFLVGYRLIMIYKFTVCHIENIWETLIFVMNMPNIYGHLDPLVFGHATKDISFNFYEGFMIFFLSLPLIICFSLSIINFCSLLLMYVIFLH